ncbi:MAG: hypothetical protein ACI3ZD_17775 [Prevotella sp.]
MKYTLVMRGHPRYPERGKKAYACAQYEGRGIMAVMNLLKRLTR